MELYLLNTLSANKQLRAVRKRRKVQRYVQKAWISRTNSNWFDCRYYCRGHFYGNPKAVEVLQPIGDVFIHLIKMIVVPIVISSIIVGVAGVGDIKKLGKLGGKTILYFEIITTVAIVVGLLAANLLHPGTGVDRSGLEKSDISSYTSTAEATEQKGFVETFVHIVPTNVFESIAAGDMLPIIFFSVLFGLGIASIGEKGKPVLRFLKARQKRCFG